MISWLLSNIWYIQSRIWMSKLKVKLNLSQLPIRICTCTHGSENWERYEGVDKKTFVNMKKTNTSGPYYKHFTSVNNDCKWWSWCHKLELHSRVINYTSRFIIYDLREYLQCWRHIRSSLTIVIYDEDMFIVQDTVYIPDRSRGHVLVVAQ